MTKEAMLEIATNYCRGLLEDAKAVVFKPHVHLTLVMRDPDDQDCYLVVSDDPDLREVAAILLDEGP